MTGTLKTESLQQNFKDFVEGSGRGCIRDTKEEIKMNVSKDYNQKYYELAVEYLKDLQYYYGDLIHDCALHIARILQKPYCEEIVHAVRWALADTWNGGCEVEEI